MKLNSNIKGVKVKPIPNYPEYLASFDGRVYSVIRRIVYETK